MKNPSRRRLQKGNLVLRSGVWYVRYYSGQAPNRKMAYLMEYEIIDGQLLTV